MLAIQLVILYLDGAISLCPDALADSWDFVYAGRDLYIHLDDSLGCCHGPSYISCRQCHAMCCRQLLHQEGKKQVKESHNSVEQDARRLVRCEGIAAMYVGSLKI